MRVEKVHIYGFGKWVDKQFIFPPEGTVEISGNNEAGKTTLRQCILYILFGSPAKQVEQFFPKKGAAAGGRIVLTGLDEKPVTIERVHGRNKNKAIVYLENGSQQSEEWLSRALQHIDRSQYQEIYSFDVNDLQKIQVLDSEALNEVLLAIGMMGSDRIYKAEKLLEKKRAELFKPFGKKPVINQLFQQLQSLQSQLTKAKEKEKAYQEYRQEIEKLEKENRQLETEKMTLQQQVEAIEKQISHHALIEDFYLARSQLTRQDTDITFPTDGLLRLEGWKEALLPLQSEENVLRNNIKETEQKIANTSPLPDREMEKLEKALRLTEEISQLTAEIDQLAGKKEALETETQSQLKALNLKVTIEEMRELDLPFYLEEYWSDLSSQIEKLTMEIRYLENEANSLKKVKEELQMEKQEEESQLIDEEIVHQYQQDIDSDKDNQEIQKQQAVWHRWNSQYQSRLRISNGAALLLVLLAVVLFIIADLNWAIPTFFIAVLQNVIVRVYGKTVAKWLRPAAPLTETFTPEAVQQRQLIVKDQAALRTRIMEIEKDMKHYQLELLKTEERLQFLKERKRQSNQKVNEQISSYPFLANVALPYWPRVYQQLIILKDRLADWLQIEERIKERERDKKKKEKKLEAFSLPDKDQLSSIMQQEKENKRTHFQLIARKEELQAQMQTILQKKKPYQLEINQLFQHAAVETEEEFIAKGKQFTDIQHVKEKYAQLHDSLFVLFSEVQIEAIKKGQFDSMEVLEKKLHDKKRGLQKINETCQKTIARLSDLKAAVDLLERNEDVSVWKHKLALKQTELEEAAKQWSVYQLAAEALKKAKTTYSLKYMPQVFEQASIYFKRLTVDRYIRIYKNEQEQLLAEDQEGFSFQVHELSQATKDQLYIAVRFALSKVMANHIALPFLIDDGFVHFDPNRKEKIAELLEEISKEHQVIYFTAHAAEKNTLSL